MAPFDRPRTTYYQSAVVTVALCSIISEIKWDTILAKDRNFFIPPSCIWRPHRKLEWCGYPTVKKFDDMRHGMIRHIPWLSRGRHRVSPRHCSCLGRSLRSPSTSSCLLPPPTRQRLCDQSFCLSFGHSFCQSVNRITDKRGNGRRPNLADMGKGWPPSSSD